MNLPLPVRWAVRQGAPRLLLRQTARRGDLTSKITIDPALRRDPFATYEQLRSAGEIVSGRLARSSVSHAVCAEVLRSSSFGVGAGSFVPNPLVRRIFAATVDPAAAGPVEPPSMLAVDPPDHTRYRRLVSKVFTPRAIAALEVRVQEIADELLEEMSGRVDLIEAYAGQLPVRVISEVLGLPDDARARLLAFGDAGVQTLDPGLSYRQYRESHRVLVDAHRWLGEHLDELRRNPGEDIFSRLVALDDEGGLTDLELRSTALLVIGAGFETTVNLLGSGVVQLLSHPDQLARLREEPQGWGNAVEEILRYDSPVQVTARAPLQETTVRGVDFRPGQLLILLLGGANRDPLVFDDPQTFDTARSNARDHLAFSGGIHFCLGAGLARTEGVVGLRTLFDRFPDLALAGPPVQRPTRVLRGYTAMPVTLGRGAVSVS
jgi:cytochrome P450